MKHLTDFLNEALVEPKATDVVALPENADVVMISPNDMEGNLSFLTIEEIKKDGGLDKVLKLQPWESVVIDEDIYVMITGDTKE